MSVFPQMGIIEESVLNTMKNRIGNNVDVSKLLPWFRIVSAGAASNEKYETVDPNYGTGGSSTGGVSTYTPGTIKESTGLILESIPTNNSFAASYGGVIDGERKSGRIGVDFNGDNVYSDGNDRIHRPSPTISSLSISNGNRGLSKKASFNITCYTLKQLEKVSEHFLEPGFVVLIEFGYNTLKSLQQKITITHTDAPCQIAQFNNYEYVLEKRKNSGGTYDGFMGYITDGGITNGDNETYNVSVELTTLGEIPAYLQIHKNGSTSTIGENGLKTTKTGLKYNIKQIENNTTGDNIGKGLFMQMFNRLPAEKQTPAVKNLFNETDANKKPWTSKENFINMDDKIREEISKLGGVTYNVNTKPKTQSTPAGTANQIQAAAYSGNNPNVATITLPDGLDLITNQSFIRLELAFEILNQYAVKLDKSKNETCKEFVPTLSFKINTSDVIIRAHKNIFSTDLSKLYVPNSELPNFGLEKALTTSAQVENSFVDVNNIVPYNGCMWEASDDKAKYAFPSTTEYKSNYLKGVTEITASAGTYGYLRNLYVNFDFFLEVISGTNLVAKDIYYEILNGISSAVNSYWEFDLFMTPNNPDPIPEDDTSSTTVHPMELSVRDTSFSGNVSNKVVDTVSRWYMQGINTPFLTSALNISIPGAMRDHILGQRSSKKVQTQMEGNPQGYLFAQGQDRVLKLLNSFREENVTTYESDDDDDVSNKQANLDLFLQKAIVLPKVYDRSVDLDKFFGSNQFDSIFFVAGWRDGNLLNDVRLVNENTLKPEDGSTPNPAILGIEFEFTTIGISGIKVGDMFKIIDLPKQYTDFGVFQVMEISHELSDSKWITTVKSQMRNMKI